MVPKKNFQKVKNCQYKNKIKDVCKDADLIVLHTEWDEFKSLEFNKKKGGKFLAMISGDVHMMTYDHGGDASNPLGQFPIFMCAPIDKKASCSGGV